jgi:predicted enzyme related to lactoylglutathione lyase
MTPRGFCWYQLRTTNLAAARAFYEAVTGLTARDEADRVALYAGDRPVGELSTLPEQAAARGAPPHWLGHISVPDVEASAQRFVALGAQRLGPPRRPSGGADIAVLRDPLGAAVALSSRPMPGHRGAIAWHELYAPDRDRALAVYAELFGWRPTEAIELGPPIGTYQMFSWHDAGQSVGGVLSIARLPQVHPQWSFYFEVADLDRALAEVTSRGGHALNSPTVAPGGARIAQCEDPQRAAFALRESPRPAP